MLDTIRNKRYTTVSTIAAVSLSSDPKSICRPLLFLLWLASVVLGLHVSSLNTLVEIIFC